MWKLKYLLTLLLIVSFAYASDNESFLPSFGDNQFYIVESGADLQFNNLFLLIDTISPIISNIIVINITNQSAIINWTTSENSNTSVDYGVIISLGNNSQADNAVKAHTTTITGLIGKTLYYYNVTSCDIADNCRIAGTFNFTTNNTIPSISNVILNSTHATNYTTENLTVYWNSTDNDGDAVYNITDWRMNGTSIAILNMPFENHSNSANNATDYSIYSNTGGVVGATFNSTGGHDAKGAYFFDGDDYINLNRNVGNFEITDQFSISAWFNSVFDGTNDVIYGNAFQTAGYHLRVTSANKARFILITDGANYNGMDSSALSAGWHHVVAMWNSSDLKVYIDGADDSQTSISGGSVTTIATSEPTKIGLDKVAEGNYFKGEIDDVRIYNRTLSAGQILALYNNRIDFIHSDETSLGENWTACITPNDGIQDGSMVCSNNLTIENTPPAAPTLLEPNDGNNTLTNLTVYFNWTDSTDIDEDSLTYFLNLTSEYCANQYFQNIPTSNFTSPELNVVTDCGYYNWTVRAYDGTDYSDYSDIFNFSIQPSIVLTLTQNTSDFGNMAIYETNDTSDNNPEPFIVQSDSNVLINVSVRALDELWATEGLGNASFQYKANATTEPNSFDFDNSQITYTPVKGSAAFAVKELKYIEDNDTAIIDINVTVPAEETPGQKSSNIILEGIQS